MRDPERDPFEIVDKTLAFAQRIISASGQKGLFTTVLVVDPRGRELVGKKAWAGSPPTDPKPRPPHIGPAKLAEILLYGDLDLPLEMSPISGLLSTGFMGGVRRLVHDYLVDIHFLTSCSGWSQESDAMMALLLNYCMTYPIQLHHVGFGYKTEEDARAAIEADERYYGVTGLYHPVDDHHRVYILTPAGHYREHQWGEDVKPGNVHWDFWTPDISPEFVINFIARQLGRRVLETNMWDHSPNSPVGVVWTDNDGRPFGVMTRKEWWNVSTA